MTNKTHFPDLRLTAPPVVIASEFELKSIQLQEGFKLPKSYCDFAKELGYGLLLNFFIIYIPMKGEDSLIKRFAILKNLINNGIKNNIFYYKPHGSPELVERLIPFGISENGDTLAWDPDETTDIDEYFIYLIGERFYEVNRCASNLFDFVEMFLDNHRGRSLLGEAYNLINNTFKPFEQYVN